MSETFAVAVVPREAAPLLQPDLLTRFKRLRLSSVFIAGLLLLIVVILVAILAPLLTPYDPILNDLASGFLPPFSPGHILGTDQFGRDEWARIIYSTQLDLQIGFLSVLFPFFFGVAVGVMTGYLGGMLDAVFMRVMW